MHAQALITVDSRGGTAAPVSGLRGLGGTVFGSAESLVGGVARPVAALFDNVTGAPAQQQKIQSLQRDVLEAVAEEAPLADVMRMICERVERIFPEVVSSVLSLDLDGRLHPLAAPSLPGLE